ncbi:MAG: lipocalin family protein [Desulfuromonadales bacterium]|nr:lipocalin family protein [Desulfuromonadales bacterium]
MRNKKLLPLLFSLFLGGCVVLPDGIEPVAGFDLQRYLGTWYEIARLDHSFERGLSRVTAEYSLREDGGVRVINRGFNAQSGEWKEATGRAYLIAGPDVGRLKVSFFGPFYGGYNVIELDRESYRWAMVCGPNRSYLWLLARQPELEEDVLKRLIGIAAELGFATGDLIRVSHE